MKSFLKTFGKKIIGVVSGFDRLVFRGTLRGLAFVSGLEAFLNRRRIRFQEIGPFFEATTERLKEASLRLALQQDRPVKYLASSKIDKEDMARTIAVRDGITEGLVCVLTAVEPCKSFEVYRNRAEKKCELVVRFRKCLHHYLYWVDPLFGFLSARIQTWFPFNIQICLNGREWLARAMDREGIAYQRADNRFTGIEDFTEAQKLMDRQLEIRWPRELGRIARLLNPIGFGIFGEYRQDYRAEYYWSVFQSEWATDVVFESAAALAEIYPALVRHGICVFSCADVLRFLGGKASGHFAGEIRSDFKRRSDGVRLKHWVDKNSIKAYPELNVFRVETTINRAQGFKVWRPKEGDPEGAREWRPMRQGIADLARRAQVSQASNERYLEALAAVDTSKPVGELLREVSQSVRWNGNKVRGVRPSWAEDVRLLGAVSRGEFCLNGFRNRDLQTLLYSGGPSDQKQARQRSARVTRLIRLLRAHGLVHKVPRTHYYRVSPKGREVLTAILTVQHITTAKLAAAAA